MPRERLSERRIAEAALDVVDEHGVDGLTMRRLAESLGASTMALYTYFPDREAVLSAVTQLLLAEVEAPADGADWRETIRRIMLSVREVGLRHRRAAPLIALFPPRTPDALAFVEAGFRALRRAGFDDASTARCYRALAAYSIGSLQIELGKYFSMHPATSAPSDSLDAATVSKHLPIVLEIGSTLAGQDDESEFRFGLELMLAGFGEIAPPPRL